MTFRSKLLSSACLIALSSGAVQAQGLSAPNTGWTGGYVGGLIGVGFGSNRMQEDVSGSPGAFSPAGTVYRLSGTGAVFGAYLGYNWQVSPSGLVGIEADLTYNTASGSAPTFTQDTVVRGKPQFAGSLRARAGLIVDRALFYVTGGLALGNPSVSVDRVGFRLSPVKILCGLASLSASARSIWLARPGRSASRASTTISARPALPT